MFSATENHVRSTKLMWSGIFPLTATTGCFIEPELDNGVFVIKLTLWNSNSPAEHPTRLFLETLHTDIDELRPHLQQLVDDITNRINCTGTL